MKTKQDYVHQYAPKCPVISSVVNDIKKPIKFVTALRGREEGFRRIRT